MYKDIRKPDKLDASNLYKIIKKMALAGMAQWIECCLQTKGSPVRFPVRAYAWVVAGSPVKGMHQRNHTLMLFSLSFPLLPPLSKNK